MTAQRLCVPAAGSSALSSCPRWIGRRTRTRAFAHPPADTDLVGSRWRWRWNPWEGRCEEVSLLTLCEKCGHQKYVYRISRDLHACLESSYIVFTSMDLHSRFFKAWIWLCKASFFLDPPQLHCWSFGHDKRTASTFRDARTFLTSTHDSTIGNQ